MYGETILKMLYRQVNDVIFDIYSADMFLIEKCIIVIARHMSNQFVLCQTNLCYEKRVQNCETVRLNSLYLCDQ